MSEIIKDILTYCLTVGFAGVVGYFFRISKRLTVLEEHDKDQIKAVDKIGELANSLARIDTKLDFILEGKIKGVKSDID